MYTHVCTHIHKQEKERYLPVLIIFIKVLTMVINYGKVRFEMNFTFVILFRVVFFFLLDGYNFYI